MIDIDTRISGFETGLVSGDTVRLFSNKKLDIR